MHDVLSSRSPLVHCLRRSMKLCWRVKFPERAIKWHCGQTIRRKECVFTVKRLSMSYQESQHLWYSNGATTSATAE